MYKVIETFADLQDYNYVYNKGDTYPREGYAPSLERIEELSSNKNRLRTPLIEEIPEVIEEPEEIPEVTKEPEEIVESASKKRRRKIEEEE